jgi:UDP-2,3-diacylglucosamine hydrolase
MPPPDPAASDRPIFFFSDAHIGSGTPGEEKAKERRLVEFLSLATREAGELFILGDLFDFWFEYRHAIPARGFEVLHRIRSLMDSGIPVRFLGGNHDFWAGPFFRTLGMTVYDGPVDLDRQGRHLYLAHGDGLAAGDRGYSFLKQVLRNPLAIGAYRLIHPDVGIPLATTSSHASRKHTADIPVVAARLWSEIALPQFARGRDAVLIGHFHHPVHWRGDGRDFIVGGDWMTHNTYTVLDKGQLTLHHWPTGQIELSGPPNP